MSVSAERPSSPAGGDESEVRIPLATYRLQFHAGFTFDDARRLVPYLSDLGISDVYASPYLMARPGSAHGYDIVDHGALNPELGGEADYDAFVAALRERGMGQILDVVPNHMGIGRGENRWWNDVLENGPGSAYADYFDVDWEPVKRELAHRLLLPILGDQYGRVLENQELALELADGGFRVRYYETLLPIAPGTATDVLEYRLDALTATLGDADADLQEYQSILTGLRHLPARTETAPERVRERTRETEVLRRRLHRLLDANEAVRASVEATVEVFNGKRGDPRSFDLLHRLLDQQAYRLSHWRVAADEINYRRFFDVNDLAALRMERPAVFQETHRLVLRLVAEGKVTGLRIDHPDGLHDPATYFRTLQAAAGRPLYVLAEKVLARGERLPVSWAIHGTTGYEFLATVNGLFVNSQGARPLTAAYTGFTGLHTPYSDVAYASRQLIMDVSLSSELSVLGRALSRLAERDRSARDFTLNSLIHALREVIACFPVYRTYIDGTDAAVSLQDRACVEVAVAFAKRRNPATSTFIFDFVRDVLLLRYPEQADPAYREDLRAFVRKFQQVTTPVTAKGIEDTAFYRYNRLVSLNEVGSDPDRFGVTVEEFHRECAARQESWPGGLSATSTHDTKRSEDVRTRISVLSEIPVTWRTALARWHRWNQRHLTVIDGRPAPDENDEYLFYQTLVGAWVLDPTAPGALAALADRLRQYMTKATREAKVHTSWVSPNTEYDEAVSRFVSRVLDPEPANQFLLDFAAFHEPVARLGMVGSLAQALLKATAPGVPDLYQGTELWDLSLVDPDNRRPVDFEARQAALAELRTRIDGGDPGSLARELVERWRDGRVKLYTIHRALDHRRRSPALFQAGAYVPLSAVGPNAARVCAFARLYQGDAALVVVPRLTAALTDGGARLPLGPDVWADTSVPLRRDLVAPAYRDVFTGTLVGASRFDGRTALAVGAVLADFPVALLVPARDAAERATPEPRARAA
jgi:(1->4)-alpha-D-glucan 1-alpha-D-glucosylmutase